MSTKFLSLFTQRHTFILLLLGFASGLPLALTSGTLQAWMTVENVDLKTIGFFSLVGQAYVFKFLWSPVMDRYIPPFAGRRRGWLLITQLLLIAGLVAMGLAEPSADLVLLAVLAVAIAFFSASQDIIFDAWKTDILPAEERGNGAAITVLGYRIAMLVSGGVALWLADRYLGWQKMYWLMAAFMLAGVVATLMAKEPVNHYLTPRTLKEAVTEPLRDFFSRNNAWLILSLIILYKLGDAFASSLTTTFLIRGVGFNPGEVGLVNKSFGLLATIAGALFGGVLMRHYSLFRSLMLFGILQAISNLGYWALSITDKHLISMASAVFIENLCGGMGTAAFVALLMTLCKPSFSATQFALLSALSAVGRVYVGPVAGWFVELWGWPLFYACSVIAALPGLILLAACRKSLEYTQQTGLFAQRQYWPCGYRSILYLLACGCFILVLWLIGIMVNAFTPLLSGSSLNLLFEIGIVVALSGIIGGTILDSLALKKRPR